MPKKKKERLNPISFYPHKPEDVIKAFMKVDPGKVEKRLKKKGLSRKGNKNNE